MPILLLAMAHVAALFGSLLLTEQLPGVRDAFAMAVLFAAMGIGALLLPSKLYDGWEHVVTDRRVISRYGRIVRSMERRAITFGRVHWHRSAAAVGDLELVVAVPFGPLRRKQRLVLRALRDPDRVFALVRGVEAPRHPGEADLPLIARLDPGERVVWGGHPEGLLLGWTDVATALLGVVLSTLSLAYGFRVAAIVIGLSRRGVSVTSQEWVLLCSAVAISWVLMTAVSGFLVWRGLFRARTLGTQTEYMLTDRRLLIRRGRVELSVDRSTIFDVACTPVRSGLSHLYLVLDTPEGRALADSGAMGFLPPPRDPVPPVLYAVRDGDALRRTILTR